MPDKKNISQWHLCEERILGVQNGSGDMSRNCVEVQVRDSPMPGTGVVAVELTEKRTDSGYILKLDPAELDSVLP